jgi:ferredoxin-NADP reductase
MFIHKYIVESAEQITGSTLLLTLKNDNSDLFTFQPGQYAAISFSRKHRPTAARCFSIVSSPTQQGRLQFSMRTKGRFTSALRDINVGDEVKVRGPFGGFVFDAERDRDVVLVAGGIGITPFMSMVRFASTVNSRSNITLIYSCPSQDDIPFKQELINLQLQNPLLKVVFVIGKGPTNELLGQTVKEGRINDQILNEVTQGRYDIKTFFICGPPGFMNTTMRILHENKVDKNNIMSEAFSQGPRTQTGQIRSWPYNVYALSAVGLSLGGLLIMASDLIKNLPPSTSLNTANVNENGTLTNSRQQDLDKLINQLSDSQNNANSSNAVYQAENAATQASTNTGATNVSSTPSTTTSGSSTTTTPAATTKVSAPAPAPTCTTTPSGVTTC